MAVIGLTGTLELVIQRMYTDYVKMYGKTLSLSLRLASILLLCYSGV